jgi:outer membrane protein TolC
MTKTFLLLALMATPLHAQTTLTLPDAIALSIQRHPSIAFADASAARARTGVGEAEAARRPTLSLDANVNQFQEPMLTAPLHGFNPQRPPVFDNTLMQGSVSLGYALFDAARSSRIARAEALADASATGRQSANMNVIAEATRAYLRVLSARETAAAHERRILALERERDRARQLVEQGRAARVVLLRADAALSAARAENASSHTEVESAENELARLTGLGNEAIRTASLPAVRPTDSATLSATEARDAARTAPELKRLASQVEAAEALRGEARGLWLPRVQLGARFIEYASSDTRPQGEWQAGLQLSYPLLTGGARGAATDRANADVRIAQAELGVAERRVDDAIDRALAAWASARARVAALESAVAQSEEVTRIDRLALNEGAGVQSDYLSAEADLFRARAALTDARALELLALVELARISGRLSTDWIATNVETHK